MIRALRRAKRAIYPKEPQQQVITINVTGEMSEHDLRDAVQRAMLRSPRYRR
jgi:hypothetical protein